MKKHSIATVAAMAGALSLAGCGGGGADTPSTPSIPDTQRSSAAATTAQSTTNACAPIQPFYWEIGDANARLAAGSIGGTTYTASTQMSIASASKWLYAAYVAQKRNAALTASDIKFLNFRSGYTNFSTCLPGQTIDSCLAYQSNGTYSSATDGSFYYNGGHMQKHASLEGLGALTSAAFAAELRTQLGTDIALAYSQPQPAGGAITTADDYARFLRKLLNRQLAMGTLLGSNPVCTNPLTCAAGVADFTPVPLTETWHYSVGHWVEDDPAVGDGAFSSPGAFGFYPWIDASQQWYGVLARRADSGSGIDSAMCGRLIRKAWVTGVAQ